MDNSINLHPEETLSDEDLQLLAAGGSSEAEEQLIRRYGRIIRSLARPYFLTGGDSEDLIQEGMLGLLNAIRRYDAAEKASFRSFAVLCIRRRMFSALRKAADNTSVSLDDCLSLESSLFDEAPSRNDNQRGPEELIIDREEALKRYRNLLQLLSAYEQSVLRCFLRGMSYREIAEITHKPEKAVDNAVQRIRRKFQKLAPGDISSG
ncbi:MAG: sigma-70 family RNA polymerase sigma factor [Oscillospiraceae bacterium]|nr:sigma-70 family RNA polymerase sigma factor [Oscillospiraceae bacterium]